MCQVQSLCSIVALSVGGSAPGEWQNPHLSLGFLPSLQTQAEKLWMIPSGLHGPRHQHLHLTSTFPTSWEFPEYLLLPPSLSNGNKTPSGSQAPCSPFLLWLSPGPAPPWPPQSTEGVEWVWVTGPRGGRQDLSSVGSSQLGSGLTVTTQNITQ